MDIRKLAIKTNTEFQWRNACKFLEVLGAGTDKNPKAKYKKDHPFILVHTYNEIVCSSYVPIGYQERNYDDLFEVLKEYKKDLENKLKLIDEAEKII